MTQASIGQKGNTLRVPCRILAENTNDYLAAHVLLGGGIDPEPGDAVCVDGADVVLAYGDRMIERREATVTRANPIVRAWTKFIAIFEITGLYEVSFSGRKNP